jgi:SEC-C motif
MSNKKKISRNAPCPCGSGKKYKNCCYGKGLDWAEDDDGAAGESTRLSVENDLEWRTGTEEHRSRHLRQQKRAKYPLGTVAYYGPDDKTTTKIAAGVFTAENAPAILKRWVATDVTTNPKIQREVTEFFKRHGVKSVAMSDGNMGCPHEEGEDFPDGGDCPFCPFWKGKQGSNGSL